MYAHPLVINVEVGTGGCEVHWYCALDGCCHGLEYYNEEASRRDRRRLDASVRELAMTGKLRDPHGHRLHGRYRVLWEFTPLDSRFVAFEHERVFYITNGAKKAKEKKQQRDYERGLAFLDEFLAQQSDTDE